MLGELPLLRIQIATNTKPRFDDASSDLCRRVGRPFPSSNPNALARSLPRKFVLGRLEDGHLHESCDLLLVSVANQLLMQLHVLMSEEIVGVVDSVAMSFPKVDS